MCACWKDRGNSEVSEVLSAPASARHCQQADPIDQLITEAARTTFSTPDACQHLGKACLSGSHPDS